MRKLFGRAIGVRFLAALAVITSFFGLLLLGIKYIIKAYLLYMTVKSVRRWWRWVMRR